MAVLTRDEGRVTSVEGMRVTAGMETFGASAPLKELQKKFGFIPENVILAAKEQIAKRR